MIDSLLAGVAGRVVSPSVYEAALDCRLRHFQRVADPDGCRSTAERYEALNRTEPTAMLLAARIRSVAAAVYATAGQPAEATADADRAMAWLTKAVAAGYTDRAHMTADDDLASLRGRADFRALVNTLPEVAPPPRPVR